MIVALGEDETRAAWEVLAPARTVPIDFLRAPDQGTVAASIIVDGVRQDVLSSSGQSAVAREICRPNPRAPTQRRPPPSVSTRAG